MNNRSRQRKVLSIALATLASGAVMADSRSQIDAGVKIAEAAFHQLNLGDDALDQRAYAKLVFPHVAKSGEGAAHEYGEGALIVKGQTVGYYSITSASNGMTLGIAPHRGVILFMTSEVLNRFRNASHWSVGSDTGLALISAGLHREIDKSALNKPTLAFVFDEAGLFDDSDIRGSTILLIKRL